MEENWSLWWKKTETKKRNRGKSVNSPEIREIKSLKSWGAMLCVKVKPQSDINALRTQT